MIKNLQEQALNLDPADLQWMVPGLIEHYSEKLKSISLEIYNGNQVGLSAITEQAGEVITNAAYHYFFVSKLWEQQRDLNSYILSSLNRFKQELIIDVTAHKRRTIVICPACSSDLIFEGKLLRCQNCSDRISNSNTPLTDLFLARIFALHSSKGYRCNQCYHFIPESAQSEFGLICPFDNCDFSDKIENMTAVAHPVRALTAKEQANKTENLDNKDIRSALENNKSTENFRQSEFLMNENLDFEDKIKIIKGIIEKQIVSATYSCRDLGLFKTLAMYRAFEELLNTEAEDILDYLIYNKLPEYSIYARIFQSFTQKMEQQLPFKYSFRKQNLEIRNILDSNLRVFLGQSEFTTEVKRNGVIPNLTIEEHVGERNNMNYGRCFLGKLISVIDDVGNNLIDRVESYDFSKIYTTLTEGMSVTIVHYRIPSHWDSGGLTILGNVRRNIVKSIRNRIKNHEL